MNTAFIKGIIPAMVTPFNEDMSLSEDGLRAVVDGLIERGVHGIFAIGSTGEFWAMTVEEKRRVYEITVEATNKRVPVYLGTCANTTAEAVQLSEYAQEAGGECISVLTPSFIRPNDEELFDHFAAVAKSVDIPVLLYGNPARTGVPLSTALVARLADAFDNIVGIKDSTGDLTQSLDYMIKCPEGFKLIMGRDTLIFAAFLHGAAAAIAASANVAPEIAVGIYENFVAGNLEEALRFQKRLAPLRLAFTFGSFPVVLKEGAEMVGLPAGPARPPIGPMTPEKREQLRNILIELGCDVKK